MAIPDPRQAAGVTRRSTDVRQYQTHLQLLTSTSVRRDASLDAIIVPAAQARAEPRPRGHAGTGPRLLAGGALQPQGPGGRG